MLTTPIPHEAAAAWLRNKPALTRSVFDSLAPHLQARAFTISGIECLDTIANVRDIAAQLPQGADWADTQAEIMAKISPWLIDPNASPDDQKKQTNAARRRAELLLRMHGWQAYAQTNYELMEAHSDVFPYRQYLSSDDGRVRPTHAALHKKILPAAHPFWQNHTPPWEFNCRCDVVAMTGEDIDDIRQREKNLPLEDQKILPPAQLHEIEKNQRMVKPGGQGYLDTRTPREKNGGASGYEYRPDLNALPLAQILDRFSPTEKNLFYTWAQTIQLPGGKTLADWWSVAPGVSGGNTTSKNITPLPAITTRKDIETYLKNQLGIKNLLFTAGTKHATWGTKIPPNAQHQHMQTIAAEMARLVDTYPTLSGKLHTLYITHSERSLAHANGPTPAMTLKTKEWPPSSWQGIAQWEQTHKKSWGTERQGTQVQDNFRHELGHTLTTPKVLTDFQLLSRKNNWTKEWFTQNVSEYAGANDYESIADSFGLFTREDYSPDTLPKELEEFLTNITK